jgi:hypothetical protein
LNLGGVGRKVRVQQFVSGRALAERVAWIKTKFVLIWTLTFNRRRGDRDDSKVCFDFDFDGKVLTLDRSSDFGKLDFSCESSTTTTTTSHVDKFV